MKDNMETNHESLVQAISALIQKPELCEKVLEEFTAPAAPVERYVQIKVDERKPRALTQKQKNRNRQIRHLSTKGYRIAAICKMTGHCYVTVKQALIGYESKYLKYVKKEAKIA